MRSQWRNRREENTRAGQFDGRWSGGRTAALGHQGKSLSASEGPVRGRERRKDLRKKQEKRERRTKGSKHRDQPKTGPAGAPLPKPKIHPRERSRALS